MTACSDRSGLSRRRDHTGPPLQATASTSQGTRMAARSGRPVHGTRARQGGSNRAGRVSRRGLHVQSREIARLRPHRGHPLLVSGWRATILHNVQSPHHFRCSHLHDHEPPPRRRFVHRKSCPQVCAQLGTSLSSDVHLSVSTCDSSRRSPLRVASAGQFVWQSRSAAVCSPTGCGLLCGQLRYTLQAPARQVSQQGTRYDGSTPLPRYWGRRT